jgi:cytochrome c-type biogenesis protein CcmH/NrfG
MAVSDFRKSVFALNFAVVFCILLFSQSVNGSTIMGTVYDNQRTPLADIDVELLDDLYRSVNRTKTGSGGRYEFSGLADGRFTVRVMPFRYDFMDESATVEISTVTVLSGSSNRVGNGFFTQDFYLRPRKGSLMDSEIGVVFAQEVPKEAERVYENAVRSLSQKRTDEGIAGLREALKIFPNYYSALHRLGREMFIKEEYGQSAELFLKAVEINPKSGTSLYYLGNSLYKLNYSKAAVVALKQALVLAPSSFQILFILGKAEAAEGNYTNAEKYLQDAKKISKTSIPDIHWELAQIYGNNLKKYKEAADELELYLKAGSYDEKHISQVKRIISNLREKAKSQKS